MVVHITHCWSNASSCSGTLCRTCNCIKRQTEAARATVLAPPLPNRPTRRHHPFQPKNRRGSDAQQFYHLDVLVLRVLRSLSQPEHTPQLRAALGELRATARRHLASTRAGIAGVPRPVVPAFLPVCLVGPLLDRMDRPGFDPFHDSAEQSALRLQWAIWRSWRKAQRSGRDVT